MNAAIPAGFVANVRKSPATDPWEPIYAQEQDGVVALGLRIDARVLKAGRSVGFVEALIYADEELIARASATFKRVV